MSLFAIGDLHLHFGAPLKSREQMTDPIWKNHEQLFAENCRRMVGPQDTLVLAGDHSWGRNLQECQDDFAYIEGLPGRKILLRGNHDMFWDAKKTQALNRQFAGRLTFLQNNYVPYRDFALTGTKGFTFEGPFYVRTVKGQRQIVGWDEEQAGHAEKIVEREAERLKISLDAAVHDGYKKLIIFLHYPPTNILERESVFTRLAEEYGVSQVIYAHCHGQSRFFDSIQGTVNGVKYSLVSGDFRKWIPAKILD